MHVGIIKCILCDTCVFRTGLYNMQYWTIIYYFSSVQQLYDMLCFKLMYISRLYARTKFYLHAIQQFKLKIYATFMPVIVLLTNVSLYGPFYLPLVWINCANESDKPTLALEINFFDSKLSKTGLTHVNIRNLWTNQICLAFWNDLLESCKINFTALRRVNRGGVELPGYAYFACCEETFRAGGSLV